MNNNFDWNSIAGGQAAVDPDLGNLQAELAAARDAAVLCTLAQFRLLQFSGNDAQAFLQNQLTCDLRQLAPSAATYGGYCTPKGRLIANFLLFRTPEAYLMQLPAALTDAVAVRLRKFVMRSQVRIDVETRMHTIGISGPDAGRILREAIGEPPRHPLEQVHYPGLTLTRLPARGFLLTAAIGKLPELWAVLAGNAMPAGTAAWDWSEIQSGIAWIRPATQEQFVPQMIGLDAVGGISFQKGCYPGQEIVARTHYLGEVKRHLRFGHCPSPAQDADTLVEGDQVRGTIVNAAPAPGGGSDFLAVVANDAGIALRLGHATGPQVDLLPLAVADANVPD